MKSARSFAFSALALGILTPVAHAGQIFSFQNPITNGSFNNWDFSTSNLFSGLNQSFAAFKNVSNIDSDISGSLTTPYNGQVSLAVTNFDSLGNFLSTQSYTATYIVSQSDNASVDSTFSGTITSGGYGTGGGFINFTTTTGKTLKIAFSDSVLSFNNFTAAKTIGFSGSLLTTGEKGNENASFAFPNSYTLSGTTADVLVHHTGTFTASIGAIGAVPEPAPLVALAMGGLALVRRRRRA